MIKNIIKKIFFLSLILIQLCGIALLIVGIVILGQVQTLEKLFKGDVYAVPVVCIAFGTIVFVTPILGCCGAIFKSHWIIIIYATILAILIIIQIIMGALVFAYFDEGKSAVNEVFLELWDLRIYDSKYFESIQTELNCCGKDKPLDWGLTLPMSCCGGSSVAGICTIAESFTTGCQSALNDFLELSKNIIGSFAICIAAIEIFGFVFACLLAHKIRKERKKLGLQTATVPDNQPANPPAN